MINQPSTKFGVYRHCGSGGMFLKKRKNPEVLALICHYWLSLKDMD